MALLGLAFGVALCAVGWWEVNELRKCHFHYNRISDDNVCKGTGQVQLESGEKVGLWFVSISFTLLALISLIG